MALCYGQFDIYTGAWFTLPAAVQTHSQLGLVSARAAFCHWFCSSFLWTEFLGANKIGDPLDSTPAFCRLLGPIGFLDW